jgi:hypothetical protein
MLAPQQLLMKDGFYVAILLRCNTEIPIHPQRTTAHVDHRRFLDLGGEGDNPRPVRPGERRRVVAAERDEMPWDIDRTLLKGTDDVDSITATDEEVLDEAYQLVCELAHRTPARPRNAGSSFVQILTGVFYGKTPGGAGHTKTVICL